MKKLLLILSSIFGLLILCLVSGYLYLINRIYPGIYLGGINLSNQTLPEARQTLEAKFHSRSTSVTYLYNNVAYPINLSPLINSVSPDQILSQAYQFGHQKFYFQTVHLSLDQNLPPSLLTQFQDLSGAINQPPVPSQITLDDNNNLVVSQSSDGLSLDEDTLKAQLFNYLATGQISNQLPVKQIPPSLTYSEASKIKDRLEQIKIKPLNLTFKNQSYTLDLNTILGMIDTTQSSLASGIVLGTKVSLEEINFNNQTLTDSKLSLDQTKLRNFLQTLSYQINQEVKEPVFNYDGKKVIDFQPPTEGRELDLEKSAQAINQNLLTDNLTSIPLVVQTTQPKNQLVNQLGIKELLGEGVSHFRGSSSDRIFNLELAASRVNGTLVPPGQTFSFDNSVGDISAASGYHQGYIIKSGQTVLDDGGGVCQDPTTLFRAVLNAGLPVVKRTAHVYRVYYYEEGFPPGLDATIYSPSVDFQFKNDTPNYILVETSWDNSTDTLYYDLYGTSDGRVATVSTPVILSSTPAPPDIHQPDPTKPKGATTQIDFASGGASVVFSRTVTRNGETIIYDTYHSNYVPQANVFLEGTQ